MGFTKLDERIVESSIMGESPTTFKVWITILAKCQANGIAYVSAVYLSSVCHLSMKNTESALLVLESPDKHCRSISGEGRRIRRVDGGYFVINYEKYRGFSPQEGDPSSPGAIRIRRWREKHKSVTAPPVVTQGNATGVTSASASSSASASVIKEKVSPDGFDAFWKRYPRHVAKQVAVKAYGAALKAGATAEDLARAVEGYRSELTRLNTGEKYCLHASTFLHEDRWRDYLGKE